MRPASAVDASAAYDELDRQPATARDARGADELARSRRPREVRRHAHGDRQGRASAEAIGVPRIGGVVGAAEDRPAPGRPLVRLCADANRDLATCTFVVAIAVAAGWRPEADFRPMIVSSTCSATAAPASTAAATTAPAHVVSLTGIAGVSQRAGASAGEDGERQPTGSS